MSGGEQKAKNDDRNRVVARAYNQAWNYGMDRHNRTVLRRVCIYLHLFRKDILFTFLALLKQSS